MRGGSLILAGGRSRRMGRPKESLPFGADTMLGRVAGLLADCAPPVAVVVRGRDQALPPLPAGVAVVSDELPGAGPLAAIAAGLRHLRTAGLGERDAAFVTGCDAPLLTAPVVGWLFDRLRADARRDAVVPEVGGTPQPLCAVYRLACLPAALTLLQEGARSARALAERVPTQFVGAAELRAVDPELLCLRGVNTPAEYEEARRAAGERPCG